MTTHTDPTKEGTAGELIARLEAATEGSRGLDVLIRNCVEGIETYPEMERDVDILVREGEPLEAIPHYTTSLDAAMTLVPEGAVWHVMTDYGDLNRAKVGPANRPSASVYNDEDRPLFEQGDGATPALALCIAALKASDGAQQNVAEEK